MKGTGDLPVDLAPQLQASIDASYLYLLDRARYAFGSVAASANGVQFYPAALTVPPGELWVINTITVEISGGASSPGDRSTAMVYVPKPNVNGVTVQFTELRLGQNNTGGVTSQSAGKVLRPFDLILSPGDGWACKFSDCILTTAATVSLALGYYRLTY